MSLKKIHFFSLIVVICVLVGVAGLGAYAMNRRSVDLHMKMMARISQEDHLHRMAELYTVDILDAFNQAVLGHIFASKAAKISKEARQTIRIHWTTFLQEAVNFTEDDKEIIDTFSAKMRVVDQSLATMSDALGRNDLEKVQRYIREYLHDEVMHQRILLTQLMDINSRTLEDQVFLIREDYSIFRRVLLGMMVIAVVSVFCIHYLFHTLVKKGMLALSHRIDMVGDKGGVSLDDEDREVLGDLSGSVERLLSATLGEEQEFASSAIHELPEGLRTVQSSLTAVKDVLSEMEGDTANFADMSKKNILISQEVLDKVQRTQDIIEETGVLAVETQSQIKAVEGVIKEIHDTSAEMSMKLGTINEGTESIDTFIATITKISEQTNVLSFNASIEAEKAGEFGQGFSVVAREIRRLSDQVASASSEISGMVDYMRATVSAGVEKMENFSSDTAGKASNIKEIELSVTRVAENIRLVSQLIDTTKAELSHYVEELQAFTEAISVMRTNAHRTTVALQQLNVDVNRFE